MRMHLPIWIVRVLIVAAVVAVHSWAIRRRGRATSAGAAAAKRGVAGTEDASATSRDLISGKPLTPR
jgi:hypothetical protein